MGTDNRAFESTDDEHTALLSPMTTQELKDRVAQQKKVKWWIGEKFASKYGAFLVFIHEATATKLTYSFINCVDGSVDGQGRKFSVALNDLDVAHLASPSTDRRDLDLSSGKAVVFIMLDPDKLGSAERAAASEMQQEASFEGKWPGTAREDERLAEARQMINDLLFRLSRQELNIPKEELDRFRDRAAHL